MTQEYQLQVWNPLMRKYVTMYISSLRYEAEKMYNKPYYKLRTRRLVQISTQTLLQSKGKQPPLK